MFPIPLAAVCGQVPAILAVFNAEQLARIDALDPAGADARLQSLRTLLDACRRDEVEHRDEAADAFARAGRGAGPLLRLWARTVGAGSVAAVAVCRRV